MDISSDNIKLQGVVFGDIMKCIDDNLIECPDVIRRKGILKNNKECFFIFTEGLINTDLLQRDFIAPLLSMEYDKLMDENRLRAISIAQISFCYDINQIIKDLFSGAIVFIFDGMNFAVSCRLDNPDKRSISEPETEKNVRGSHEGFIEVSKTNMAILRRRVKNENLKFKKIQIGATTNQTVTIAYIQGIANPELLEELYSRIEKINIDGVMGSGYIEQLIADRPNSPFPQFLATERPDKVVASLLEGRLAIIVEGTPVLLIVPVTFSSFFHAPDDYNIHWLFGTFLKLLRFFALILAIYLPAIYVAITSFHYYMVPLKLLIPLAESRERVPFPPYVEALIMEITIELLREASIRLPTYIGTSIGVIGGIIIGQAAVEAGIVSVLMIIVVAITAIASYVTPIYDMGFALRLFRFIIMLASSILGVIGILICTVLLSAHLLSLESLGQPYFQPFVPFRFKDLKDAFIRMPLQHMSKRPSESQPVDKERGEGNG